MSLLDLNAVPDPRPASAGEHNLQVASAEFKINEETGRKMVSIMFTCVDDPAADPIFEHMVFPKDGDKENAKLLMLRRAKALAEALAIPMSIDPDNTQEMTGLAASLVGKTCWVVTGIEPSLKGDRLNATVMQYLKK